MDFGVKPTVGGHDYESTITQATLAEERGFDSVSMGEHHGLPNYWSATLLALGGIATRTGSLELGTTVKILPLTNPVELASRIGLLDVMSDGRTSLGFGVGWLEQEFDAYGVPMSERGARMDEYLEILHALFEPGPTTFDGTYYQFEGFEPSPRPVQTPRPEFMIGGMSEIAYERAAEYGDGWIAPGGRIEDIAADIEAYRTYDDGRVSIANHVTVVRETREAAFADGKDLLRTFKRPLVDVQHPNSPGSMEEVNRLIEDGFEEFVEERFVLCGTPDDCIEKIQRIHDRTRFDEFGLQVSAWGWPSEKAEETIDLMGRDVLPSF